MFMLSLPVAKFPSIAAVAPTIGRRSIQEQFELRIDVVIAGLAARLAHEN